MICYISESDQNENLHNNEIKETGTQAPVNFHRCRVFSM